MKNSLETRLGVFFALALIAGILIMELAGGLDFLQKGKHITARFNGVQDLKPGDPVKVAGVEVGTVAKVAIADNRVQITMKVDPDAQIRTDSRASIRFMGLMGQNYVSITFGSSTAPFIESGHELQTDEQGDLSTLLAKLEGAAAAASAIATNVSGGGVADLLGIVTDFIKQNSPRMTAVLANMQTVSSDMAAGRGTIGKLLQDDSLYNNSLSAITNLNLAAADARGIVEDAHLTLRSVREGQGTVGKLINDPGLYNEATASMTNLREILEKINQGKGSIGPLVNDPTFYRNVRLTLQKVEKATEGLEDQGPLSVLGTVAGSLF